MIFLNRFAQVSILYKSQNKLKMLCQSVFTESLALGGGDESSEVEMSIFVMRATYTSAKLVSRMRCSWHWKSAIFS